MQYSVVNYKTVKENSDFRIDGEYYHPLFLELELKIENLKNSSFGELVREIRCGPFGSTVLKDTYLDDGVIVARPFNLINFSLETENLVFIDENDLGKGLKLYQEGDIFFSRVGDVRCGIVPKFEKKITISPNIIAVKVDRKKINPYYATIFFNSKYGFPQIVRGLKVVAQPTIQTDLIAKLKIVVPSPSFQNTIESLFVKALILQDNCNFLYSQAEQLLLSELGLLNWKPKHELAFVKNFFDTKESDRFDAEYFQPKYEEIVEAVKKYKGEFDKLGNLVKIKDKNFTPKENEQYKYIELANISSNGEINGYTENFGNELPSRARRKVQKGDLIVSSIEGSLESIALITEDWKNSLCSTGFFTINSDKINSETLLVLLKTKVGQLQLKKGCKGTILTAIGKDELSRIVLPKIDSKTQEEIKKKITEMYETKKLSKSLLEIAKRGVEVAIEKDEHEAEEWIKGKVDKKII